MFFFRSPASYTLEDLSKTPILERVYSTELTPARGSVSFFARVHKVFKKNPENNLAFVQVKYPDLGRGTALVPLDQLENLKLSRDLKDVPE